MEKVRVMIVDDEHDFLKIVKLNLESTGKYEVLALSAATDIISQIHNFRPEVILIDSLMPSVKGEDACQMLKDDPIAKNIPCIALSALERMKDKQKMYKAGVVDYIVKPVEKDDLIRKIEEALKLG